MGHPHPNLPPSRGKGTGRAYLQDTNEWGQNIEMFNKETIDALMEDLRGKYGDDPDWDQVLRDTHLGVAWSDAGVELKDIDPRVIEAIERHQG